MTHSLFPALATVPLLGPGGIVPAYRTVTLEALRKYSPDPLGTAGSKIVGGRYNAPVEFAGGT